MSSREAIITVHGLDFLASAASPAKSRVEAVIETFLVRIGLVARQKLGSAVTVYVAEDLLFCKRISLPAKLSGLRQAIRYQLDMVLPFPEGTYLSSYVTERRKKETVVTVYAASREAIEPHLQALTEQGYSITGLFPLSQRYLDRSLVKKKWALLLPGAMELLLPGAMGTLLTFANGRLQERQLCPSPPTAVEARELSRCEMVYCPEAEEESGFEDPVALTGGGAAHKVFNLLPASYRRPDYFRYCILGLAALNVVVLALLLGAREYRFYSSANQVEAEIAKLQPTMKKINALGSQETQIQKEIDRLSAIGKNPDLIALLTTLTAKLPPTAYLDQLRLEQKDTTILYLDGFADDMAELPVNLQSLGDVRLKSTSRRNNKNYFQLEITLP